MPIEKKRERVGGSIFSFNMIYYKNKRKIRLINVNINIDLVIGKSNLKPNKFHFIVRRVKSCYSEEYKIINED